MSFATVCGKKQGRNVQGGKPRLRAWASAACLVLAAQVGAADPAVTWWKGSTPAQAFLATDLAFDWADGASRPAPTLVSLERPAEDAAALSAAIRGRFGASAAAVLYPTQDRTPGTEMLVTRQFMVQFRPGVDAAAALGRVGAFAVAPVSYINNGWLAEATGEDVLASITTANALQGTPDVVFASPEIGRSLKPRLTPDDNSYARFQWYLRNRGSQAVNALAGEDINVETAWDVATGAGIRVAVVDDGVDLTHEDLADNILNGIGYDFAEDDEDPSPGFFPSGQPNEHGTAVAGLIAAVTNNALGMAGVAFDAKLIPIRLTSGPLGVTDGLAGSALLHSIFGGTSVHIYNNSWGPLDTGTNIDAIGPGLDAALEFGTTRGREGLGAIYVWAAGNGGCVNDNVNLDGFASDRRVIAVSSTDARGRASHYSEPGAAILVNAPSSYGSCPNSGTQGIYTLDLTGAAGTNDGDFRDDFGMPDTYGPPDERQDVPTGRTTWGGTSASAALVSGVIALGLQVNEELKVRDVMHLLVNTAEKNDPSSPTWITNGAGKHFSHQYGFGRVDADAFVQAAARFSPVPAAEVLITTETLSLAQLIPDAGNPLERTFTVSGPADFKVEHVEVISTIFHNSRGQLLVELESPSGTVSTLVQSRTDPSDNYVGWKATTVANWGETPNGTWKYRVQDRLAGTLGQYSAVEIRVWGYRSGIFPTPTPTPTPTLTPTPSPSPSPTPVIFPSFVELADRLLRFQVEANPIHDVNADGVVDAADFVALSEKLAR